MAKWLSLNGLRPMAFAIGAALVVTGCGGIEIESKLLDQVGLSTKAQNAGKKEPKLASRAPLIVPPSTEKLPVPGEAGTQVAVVESSFPTNPEEIEASEKKVLEAKRKEECSEDSGKFGPRQSGTLDDFEGVGNESKPDCSSPLKDLLGNAL